MGDSDHAVRGRFLLWAGISLIGFLRRRSLAYLFGSGRAEGWAASFAVAHLTYATSEIYAVQLLGGVPRSLDPSLPLAAVLGLCVGTGVFEELAFRGIVLEGLTGVLSRPAAHTLTVLAFWAVHFRTPIEWPPLLLFGLSLGFLREYARSLWPCAAAHALIDFYPTLRFAS